MIKMTVTRLLLMGDVPSSDGKLASVAVSHPGVRVMEDDWWTKPVMTFLGQAFYADRLDGGYRGYLTKLVDLRAHHGLYVTVEVYDPLYDDVPGYEDSVVPATMPS